MDSQKKEISYCGDFSLEVLFSDIDKDHVGFVDFQNLNEYFKTNNYYPYEEEIISILRRLDRNNDGRLTSAELQQGFKPLDKLKPKLYSTPMIPNQNERNQSATKNLSNTSQKHMKTSSITYVSSNSKKNNSSPYYKSGTIYRSPIASKKNNEEENSDSYSKITTKFEKYDTSANKLANSNLTNLNLTAAETLKTPGIYCYYPYEPVRKAFSPLKEQIMKSSNLDGSPKLGKINNNEKNLVEKYDKFNSYRAKYGSGNEYKSPNVLKNYSRLDETGGRGGLKNELVNYFKKVMHFESDIEKNKQDLFFRPDFNLFDLYMVFDREKKGYCFLNDFEQGFKLMNINISGREAVLFFKKFEKNNCGRLRLAEFSKVFAPILLEGQPQTERRSINNEGQFDYYEVMKF